MDRAAATGLLYNYIEYVSPEDAEGLKHAVVKVQRGKISARPAKSSQETVDSFYGGKPTLIMNKSEPTALAPKIPCDDPLYDEIMGYKRSIYRAALRKIIDEV